MNDKSVIFNGKINKNSDININISSNTIRYGITIFEAPKIVRIHNDYYLFRFDDYYHRLKRSCEILKIDFQYGINDLIKMIKSIINTTEWKETYGVRFNVFDVKESELLGDVDNNVFVSYLDTGKRNDYKLQSKCIKTSKLIRTSNNTLFELKTPSNYVNARIELIDDKEYDDILYLNQNSEVCELSRSNIFFIKNKEVYTPKLECGLLDGITRKTVIDICNELGIKINLCSIKKQDIEEYDASFCVGTTNGIVPIKRIDKNACYDTNNIIMNKIADYYDFILSEEGMTKYGKWFLKL